MRTKRLDQDAGHPKTTGVDVQNVDTCNPVGQISAKTKAVLELVQGNGGDDFGELVDLYRNADSFMDEGIKSAIVAKMKEKLAELKQKVDGGEKIAEFHESYRSGEPEIYGRDTVLSKLLRLEGDPINSDGCVTDILYSACGDWDTTMWLWRQFSSINMRASVDPRSDEFLRKHLETYGGDEKKLWGAHEKFNHGSRRAKFIGEYIHEMRRGPKLEQLERAKGDYDALVQLGGYDIDKEFRVAIDEILPAMIGECGGDFWKLVDLYEKEYCSRPLVKEAVEAALLPEIAECGDDFNKLAELRAKAPSGLKGIIDEAATSMCKKDPSKIMALTKSSLAKPLSKFIVFNSDALEADFDVLKGLLALGVGDDRVASSLLATSVSGLLAKFIEAHKTDLDKLLVLAEILKGADDKKGDKYPEINEAIGGALLFAVQQCGGDFVKLVDLYERMPEKVRDKVTQIFIDALEDSPQSLVVYCDHDIEKLCAVKKPAQASYTLDQAIDGAVKEAMKLIMQPAVSQCGDSLEKLSELYKKYEKNNEGEPYPRRKQEATNEVFGTAIDGLIPSLLIECGGDLAKLDGLYGKLPNHFHYELAGETVKEAARKIVESLVDGCPDDLDELVALNKGIPSQFKGGMWVNVETRVKNLLPLAVAQCNGSVDELGKLRGEKLGYSFKAEFDEVVKDSLQVFVRGCGGDFGKQVALYNMVSPECQALMQSSIKVR